MAIVTLTSDLGTRDFYLGALKGAILSSNPGVSITDITHQVKAFDIKEAAFTVRNAYAYFPKGSIHIVHVNSSGGNNKLLLALANGHYFLTFDNGFLSVVFEKTPHETYEINEELLLNNTLLFEGAIAKVVNLLVQEFQPTDFAHLTTETINYRMLQPITTPGSIRGSVIHVDNFGNAVVNVSRAAFSQFIGNKAFSIMASAGSIREISKTYSDVEEGDMVCLFNAAGYLEIGINKGRADNLLGLKVDSTVLILAD